MYTTAVMNPHLPPPFLYYCSDMTEVGLLRSKMNLSLEPISPGTWIWKKQSNCMSSFPSVMYYWAVMLMQDATWGKGMGGGVIQRPLCHSVSSVHSVQTEQWENLWFCQSVCSLKKSHYLILFALYASNNQLHCWYITYMTASPPKEILFCTAVSYDSTLRRYFCCTLTQYLSLHTSLSSLTSIIPILPVKISIAHTMERPVQQILSFIT